MRSPCHSAERETALRLAKGLAERNGLSFEDIAVAQGVKE